MKNPHIDTLFQGEYSKQFEFDDAVASVFDNMAIRSIPLYKENHKLLAGTLSYFFPSPRTSPLKILDLGHATGETLFFLEESLANEKYPLILKGIDQSSSMVKISQQKQTQRVSSPFSSLSFEQEDLLTSQSLNGPEGYWDVFLCFYTLQFLSPSLRLSLLKKLYSQLPKGGILFMAEKIVSSSETLLPLQQYLHESFKHANGYSWLEISKKRKSLEGYLIPWKKEEYTNFLNEAGFIEQDLLCCWSNFVTFIAIK